MDIKELRPFFLSGAGQTSPIAEPEPEIRSDGENAPHSSAASTADTENVAVGHGGWGCLFLNWWWGWCLFEKKIIMCFYDFCSVGQHLVGRVLPFAPSQKGGSSFFDPRVIAIQLPLPFPQPAQYKCVRAALGTYNAKREELRWKTESTIDGLVYAT